MIAGWGTRKAVVSIACANCALTNMPGSRSACGLGKRRAERDRSGALVDEHLAELDSAGVAIE